MGDQVLRRFRLISERPAQRFVALLDRRRYRLSIWWNTRAAQWILDLLDLNEEPIIQGLVIVPNRDLLVQFKSDPRVPPGRLFVIESGFGAQDISFQSLGANHQ